MSRSARVLFAHERLSVRRVVEQALRREGFDVETVAHGEAARQRLAEAAWDGFVVDVALPGLPGYEFLDVARRHDGIGAEVIILVASVYRKTSYKRRPSRLYGADDYVEIHHLCDQLPTKLRHHLGLPDMVFPGGAEALEEELRVEGDARLDNESRGGDRLAQLIVADMVLYNGERILAAHDLATAQTAVAEDLDSARDLFGQLYHGKDTELAGRDPVGEAFSRLMRAMGRAEENRHG